MLTPVLALVVNVILLQLIFVWRRPGKLAQAGPVNIDFVDIKPRVLVRLPVDARPERTKAVPRLADEIEDVQVVVRGMRAGRIPGGCRRLAQLGTPVGGSRCDSAAGACAPTASVLRRVSAVLDAAPAPL